MFLAELKVVSNGIVGVIWTGALEKIRTGMIQTHRNKVGKLYRGKIILVEYFPEVNYKVF